MTNMTLFSQSGIDEIDFILKKDIYARKWVLPTSKTITWSTVTDSYTGVYNSIFGIIDQNQLKQTLSVLQRYAEIANINFQYTTPSSPSSADLLIYNIKTADYNGVAVANPGSSSATIGLRAHYDEFNSLFYQDWQVTAHELGHILGLSHTYAKIDEKWTQSAYDKKYDTLDTVMSYNKLKGRLYTDKSNPNWPNGYFEAKVDLGIYDIAAIQYLYGANESFNSGNTIYKFSTDPFYTTIWDGGGIDTIDLSNFSLGSTLNLQNGTRSDIPFKPSDTTTTEDYTGKRAIGIAYGANIENAIGTQGNDTIYGNELSNSIRGLDGDDIIYGGAGNDSLSGGNGNDILYGGEGDDELWATSGSDLLYGGTGNDTYYIWDSAHTIIEYQNEGRDTIKISSDRILSYQLPANVENLDSPWLANNISITGNDLSNMIQVGSGNSVITGGKGDDLLCGGNGSDTYIFNRGDGSDRIIEAGKGSPSPETDVDILKFNSISADQLWFSKQEYYGCLVVSIIGTNDKVSIEQWYTSKQAKGSECFIEIFQSSDGKTLTFDKVDQLVNAMAAFSPPALGQTTLPSNYQQALSGAIAAAWS